ncbi:MAG: UTP--glucose-1-phosphate uridylyltransferase [Rhodospirillaceae bacterium]|nr:UTP--glucose-1-phosphate uridylyltransferase [Rhodospirillaceae bacterium]MEC8661994.1 UTP--glucose-1-phosphate uridylyltransferase GalU [Pseudomonadota bacterium]HCI19610.1 UTP--glucose-1-phosphate uridylyltransferase [Alphaproteobacteria bacterium]|tara:strand:- start:1053 stop:1907 length:855 start_codon:yes stop_codon:yes gene_type:complete
MIKKAIFPVGGLGTRFLPATKAMPKEMLPIVDKPLIQYAVEEAAAAGIEQFIFVTGRNKSAIEDHFDHSFELEHSLAVRGKDAAMDVVGGMMKVPGSVIYVRQQQPAGLGHAVWCARHLVGDEPVAILLADDLIKGRSCMKEMVDAYDGGNMVAVMDVPRDQTGAYGIVTPGKTHGQKVDIAGLVEKPMPADAPSTTAVVGRYIISPSVFDTLGLQEQGAGGEIQLTDALAKQIGTAPFTGLHFSGERFDCGSKVGFLQANIAFGLDNPDMADALQEWLRDHIE